MVAGAKVMGRGGKDGAHKNKRRGDNRGSTSKGGTVMGMNTSK